MERGRSSDAIASLLELEQLEPREALWSHRLGDALRRANRQGEAAEAFIRAMERYRASGFLPKAIAMAKLVESLDPSKIGLVARLGVHTEQPAAKPMPVPRMLAPVLDDEEVPISVQPMEEEGEDFLDDDDFDLVEEDESSDPERMEALAGVRLFANLPSDALAALASVSDLVEALSGEAILVREELATALYVIVEGEARVELAVPIRLVAGDVFGESCLLDEGRRTATVRAVTSMVLLRIEKSRLAAIAQAHPALDSNLFELMSRRLVGDLVSTSALFASFDTDQRVELAKMFEVMAVERGGLLAEEGKRADGLYIVLAGDVVAEGRGGVVRVQRGTTFGQGSLLGSKPSAVTVRAETEAVVLRLPASRFSTLAMCYPPVLAILSDESDERLLNRESGVLRTSTAPIHLQRRPRSVA